MKIILSIFFSLFIINAIAQSDEPALEKELYNLPGVSFKKISQPGDLFLKYDLLVKQPIDHQHPQKGSFYQRVQLLHKGFNNSTVMETEGYWLWGTGSEIEKVLNANDLDIEYRFYGKSIPDSIPWEYLTIEQATADLHAINELFRNIYKRKWISSGISKGGETTIYYKYFYPQDVDLSIPYVAPIDNSLEDKRIYHFFDTIGTAECRNKLFQFQLFLLQHENESLEKLKWYSRGAGLHYNYTGSIGKSFEYAVLEYPFSFWQYNGDCNSIPANKLLDDYIESLLKNTDIYAFADEGLKLFEAHYYQASTQSGYYGYDITSFKKYLHWFKENPSASFPPKAAVIKPFDSTLNENVQKWLDINGNNILYIYGGIDTWTAAGVIVSDKVNSKRFVVPNATHATARIKNMGADMQQEFTQKVKEMTGLEVNIAALK
ncbi:MAG: S28 family serine protease [Panacibacter sp.]